MRVCYDGLWKMLIDKKMKRTDLVETAHVSSNVISRMGHEAPVSMESIAKICAYFNCGVDDILKFEDVSELLKE